MAENHLFNCECLTCRAADERKVAAAYAAHVAREAEKSACPLCTIGARGGLCFDCHGRRHSLSVVTTNELLLALLAENRAMAAHLKTMDNEMAGMAGEIKALAKRVPTEYGVLVRSSELEKHSLNRR
jgi:hypothetical protein